ncbi:hypothetical protein GOP47_0005076 [Adiantum capillus-veneris]|uniref:Pseudouridine synthase I TruA alpha/beta domain-containing protein n=1 Tax=Adiantum capillus-veneris TaxID=13818 RepID=A0A9D4ZMW7_ADICA|nr:hypothetical protein GOP47_0005076 [Adiantum capillus-veneris]
MSIPATRAGGATASAFSTTFRGSCSIWQGEYTTQCLRSRRWMCSLGTSVPQTVSPSSLSQCKSIKRKVALWVGYVGTDYKGLQIQRTSAAGQTIEQELETAIFRAGGILESNFGSLEKVGWMRSSRTDKGVHSLSTVISLKIEVNPEAWGCNDDGIGFADKINQYLPRTIKIFGIAPVNKSFDPRRGCRTRTYRYLLPSAAVGVTESTSIEEVQQHISRFQIILSSFVGHYPYHNYTIRSQYRKKSSASNKKDSMKHDIKQEDSQLPLSVSDYSSDEDESCNDELSSLPVLSTSTSPKQADELSSPPPKIFWLHEINIADKIFSAHFRTVFSFTCGGLQNFKGLQFLELNVHGESFMLHQIRKMIGTAVAVMRDVLPLDVIPISLSCSARVVLPIAPSEGLFLASNDFYPFRTLLRPRGAPQMENLPKLEMSAKVLERKEKFWHDVLRPHMVDLLQNNKALWEGWLELLERRRICESEMQPVRRAWSEWRLQVERQKMGQKASMENGEKVGDAVFRMVDSKDHKTDLTNPL